MIPKIEKLSSLIDSETGKPAKASDILDREGLNLWHAIVLVMDKINEVVGVVNEISRRIDMK